MADNRLLTRYPGEPGMIGGSNKVLTMRQSAAYIGRSYKNFAASYLAWGIAYHRIGGRVYFRERDLEGFLERTRQAA